LPGGVRRLSRPSGKTCRLGKCSRSRENSDACFGFAGARVNWEQATRPVWAFSGQERPIGLNIRYPGFPGFEEASPLTLTRWFSFKGRISRKTWWVCYFLVPLVINVGAVLLDDFVLQIKLYPGFLGEGFVNLPVMSLTALAISLWVTMAGQAKRWHDRGKTGWAVLFTMIPSVLMAAPLLYANRVPEEFWFILLISCVPFMSVFLFPFLVIREIRDAEIAILYEPMKFLVAIVVLSLPVLLLLLGGGLMVFVGGFMRGVSGPNRFGPDPLAPPETTNIALRPPPH
jgi:uncharacterized membrane protein YhaH (DUF805 family)